MTMENYGLTTPKTMLESIASVYESVEKILCIHSKLNKIAMSITQGAGYNGFKRWHACRSKEFFNLELKLKRELYKKFRLTETFKEYDLSYNPTTIEEHLKSWDKALQDGIEELGKLNNKYYELAGTCSCTIDCARSIMEKDFEKVGKYLKRFTESDWLTLDMHIVDDQLHKKYKKKEKKYGFECY